MTGHCALISGVLSILRLSLYQLRARSIRAFEFDQPPTLWSSLLRPGWACQPLFAHHRHGRYRIHAMHCVRMRAVKLIVAATASGGIGKDGKLPWHLPTDMAFFKSQTLAAASMKQNAVIMGRKTWSSIPAKFRPLNDRINVVLSASADVREAENIPADVLVARSLEDAVALLSSEQFADKIDSIFVIGGAAAFQEALSSAGKVVCDTIYLTRVHSEVACDVSIPAIDDSIYALTELKAKQKENDIEFQFLTYKNRQLHGLQRSCRPTGIVGPRHEEYQYLDQIRDIIATGVVRDDRTGVGTISKFGMTSRWSLRDDVFPLLTTKKVFWRGVAEELLWFVSGNTSAKFLQDKGIHIWDGNGSREFLDKVGLGHREEGDLGPVYGFQWRHFGAKYDTMHSDYSGKGVDQLADVIDKIKNKPDDRRIILTAWNPAALKEMALPPCHMFAQFYVQNGELFCQMYQRSGDMGLGVPFNIASYSLLTRMIAQVCGLKAGEFIHVLGDAHVYKNHVEPLLLQLEREPKTFPKLKIDPSIKDINDFKFEHFVVEGYEYHPPIKMEMAV